MKKLLILILGAALGIAGFIFVVHSFYNIHITAVFEELEPFPRNLNVYYKGFKLGRSVRVRPSKDFTNTRVDMILNAKGISLPDNITAKVKRKDKKDYIELEYPDAPSITDIKNHSVIQGKKSFDISGYIDEQAEGGGLDEIKDNLNDTVESAGDTLDALTELIGTANDILKDLRPSLKITGENRATKNLENASLNVSNITKHADSQTISLVDCVIQNTNAVIENVNVVVSNVNDIVKGFKATLSKRFAGMKIMFGKPIG